MSITSRASDKVTLRRCLGSNLSTANPQKSQRALHTLVMANCKYPGRPWVSTSRISRQAFGFVLRTGAGLAEGDAADTVEGCSRTCAERLDGPVFNMLFGVCSGLSRISWPSTRPGGNPFLWSIVSRRQEACPEPVEGAHSNQTRPSGKRSEPFDRLRVYLVTRLRPTGYDGQGSAAT